MLVAKNNIDLEKINPARVRKVLSFIPKFENPDIDFGTGPDLVKKDDVLHWKPAVFSETVSQFIQACYDANLVQPFDWTSWADEHKGELSSDGFIQKAGLETIIKLITGHIRTERFVEGHLLSVLKDGTMLKILKRLKQVV
jgi:hypothetical protein